MPCYNNHKLSRRTRGKSCPAGVCFAFRNDITNFGTGTLRKSKSTNLGLNLQKEHNFTRQRRQSFPKALCDELGLDAHDESFAKIGSSTSHLQNYSTLTGGKTHNLFCRKLADAHKLTHSPVDVCNQHTALNNLSPAHRCSDVDDSFSKKLTLDIATDFDEISCPENVSSSHTELNEKRVKCDASCIKQSVHYLAKDDNENILFGLLTAPEHTEETFDRTGKYLEDSSCSELNQNPALCEIYSSCNKQNEQGIEDGNKILLFDLLEATQDSKKVLSNVDETTKYLHNSFFNTLDNSSFKEQTFQAKEGIDFLTPAEDQEKTENAQNALSNLNGQHLDNSVLSRFLQEVNRLEVIDSEDNFSHLIHNSPIPDLTAFTDSNVARLESHIQGTELLVENLASQVEDAKNEIEMSKRKQENEINDLISLNEEMQTIWSAKETEVREILEKFSAYRDAVEADSKEKDEIYSEEINKREMLIKDLQLAKDALQEELARQTGALREVLDDVQNFEATQVEQLGDVNQLVACLLETFSDQETSLVCQSISVKLETSIATIKEKDYARYISCLNISGTEAQSSEEFKRNYRDRKLGKSLSSSADEGTGYSILSSSDGERNDYIAVNGSALNSEPVSPEQFSSEDFRSCIPIAAGNDEFYETLEEDFGRLLEEVDEIGNDGLVEGYITKKAVVKLLEEQWSKYQFLCKEKDAEIQHWIRKHKQDTRDLQSILEEQERAEAKSSESLAELQSEIDKLRQRNKFLESEVEFAKEQGEDDVCFLKENFQKDLSAQLRRQSQSFLSAKEDTRNELAELESKNEELEKGNQDLRREIEDHCIEIKSWVSDILRLSEEDYNDECHSITDVLAKLHKIIIENKRTMDDLQEELKEYRMKVHEPGSPDTLSRSWGGHSWNSMELQKELCRNCKQAKWQRVLMGSFDLVDSVLEVKQDEVERFVDKLSVDDSKYRKKRSLKDSLELADDQLEHLQRLSRQEFGSLETLGEDSLEGSSGRNSRENDVVDGQSGSKLGDDPCQSNAECGDEMSNGRSNTEFGDGQSNAEFGDDLSNGRSNAEFGNGQSNAEFGDDLSNGRSNTEFKDEILNARSREENNSTDKTDKNSASNVDKDCAENSDESWKNIHVSPRLSTQYSVLSDPEFTGLHKELNLENNESRGNKNTEIGAEGANDEDRELEIICEDGDNDEQWLIERDNDEQWLIDEGSKEHEEDQDRVNVVNLYRSLIVDSPQPKDFVDGRKGDGFDGESGEASEFNDQCGDQTGKFDDKSDDQITFKENTFNHCEIYNHDNNHDDNQSVVPGDVTFSIPKIIVGKDFNENFLETHEQESSNVEENYFNEISETANGEFDVESSDQNGEYTDQVGKCGDESGDSNSNSSVPKDKGIPIDGFDFKENLQPVLKDEIIIKNIVKPQSKISKSWSISTDQKNSIFEFDGNFGDETPPSTTAHCSANLENFKTKLMEVISNQRKDQEDQIFRELEETKSELREFQSEYEKLDKLCEDYRNYVDEYSGNLKRKNEELSKLRLSSGIMKTEIEWLRQALGITRNYAKL